jgi:hypothetical protein
VIDGWIFQLDLLFSPTIVIFVLISRNDDSIIEGSWKKSKEREECHC